MTIILDNVLCGLEVAVMRLRSAMLAVSVGVLVTGGCGSSDMSGAGGARGACPTAPIPVVVSVDQWGDIVSRLAGDCGAVTIIFKSSSADPHDYELTPADAAKFTGAKLVVVNGLDYDPWADKTVATVDEKPVVVNGGKVVGRHNGDNPHLWYGPGYVSRIADAVTSRLKKLEPKDAAYFEQRRKAWRTSMRPYDVEIAKIKTGANGKTYAATEGIFDYMARAVGLTDETPRGYATATANESDPSPGDVNDFEQAIADKRIGVLIYNTQTQGAIPEQIRGRAQRAEVPVVNVTESVPPKFKTFAAWQVSQLEELAAALAA